MLKNTPVTVLVIEDDAFLQRAYQAKFKKEGFIVVAATDGESGLKLAREGKPNIILLDLMLPKISGFDVLEALMKDKATADVPVIILSNLGQESDRVRGTDLGAKEYIVKANSSLDEIVKKVRKYAASS
ncbi:MAG: response regulator [Candidatus Kerfeldbacteria bacterium]|nr:response regulator [Candidatus Kerfeldbacteria bacterium]